MKKTVTFLYICAMVCAYTVLGSIEAAETKRILIVPGHDDDYSGAQFGSVKEVELNRIVAKHLQKELSKHKNVKVINAHDDDGYASFMEKYFKKESKKIDSFVKKAKKAFAKEVEKGRIEVTEAVPHGTATPVSAKRLYGINKWANENKIDLVVHIHFNDYGSRTAYGGAYSGFSVYVPHNDLKNGRKSISIGDDIHDSLSKIAFSSNNPTEAKHTGAIEDHELIALGANNTLKVPSVLIEYSYIYEPHVQSDFFDRVAQEYAHRTYVGLSDFLKTPGEHASVKPHEWKHDIASGTIPYPTVDVFMLQTALKASGFFPTASSVETGCSIGGIFEICTTDALMKFQERHGIKATGQLDSSTRKVLNSLF